MRHYSPLVDLAPSARLSGFGWVPSFLWMGSVFLVTTVFDVTNPSFVAHSLRVIARAQLERLAKRGLLLVVNGAPISAAANVHERSTARRCRHRHWIKIMLGLLWVTGFVKMATHLKSPFEKSLREVPSRSPFFEKSLRFVPPTLAREQPCVVVDLARCASALVRPTGASRSVTSQNPTSLFHT